MLTETQSYSLLSDLMCQGRVEPIVERIERDFPGLGADANLFLQIYLTYYSKRHFPLFEMQVDTAAWRKAYRLYRDDVLSERRAELSKEGET